MRWEPQKFITECVGCNQEESGSPWCYFEEDDITKFRFNEVVSFWVEAQKFINW
jgi:hypothetical protein